MAMTEIETAIRRKAIHVACERVKAGRIIAKPETTLITLGRTPSKPLLHLLHFVQVARTLSHTVSFHKMDSV
jgi:hypothetical protein